MPLEDSYMEQLKSSIADYKNTGGRLGGSITAALFLKEFVATDKVRGAAWWWWLVVLLGGGGWGLIC
jgi:leucyl aminopeptidase